ncbi:MAG TPA: hypothetical protein VMM18_13680 [Gemmatimonadaceae bacterium]|nr:hypothetical protein [Gemmatimonadaceae bacterium]
MSEPRAPSCRHASVAIALVAALAATAGAQEREVQKHLFSSSEGKLLGFYSAALAFTAGAPSLGKGRWRMEVGLEAAYVPHLNREQRTAGSDKPQSSNLAPALPRPRLAFSLPWQVRAEASWLPPLRVFDVEANLISLALSRPIGDFAGVQLVPRIAATAGRIEGAITCNEDLTRGTSDEQVYYTAVCFGRESRDHFEPRHLSLELLGSRPMMHGRLVPFATAGVRREWLRFDIGVIRHDGTRDPDHPILTMEATRPFATAGLQWRPGPRLGTGVEVVVAPGSLVTARVLASFLFPTP